LKVNNDFIKWGGSRTIAIPYDIDSEDLQSLLRQINGVLFTGGGLDLVDKKTRKEHPYFTTAKRIVNYSKWMKDVKNQDWPVMGICQGLQTISIMHSYDDIDVLNDINIYGKELKVDWDVAANTQSKMF